MQPGFDFDCTSEARYVHLKWTHPKMQVLWDIIVPGTGLNIYRNFEDSKFPSLLGWNRPRIFSSTV